MAENMTANGELNTDTEQKSETSKHILAVPVAPAVETEQNDVPDADSVKTQQNDDAAVADVAPAAPELVGMPISGAKKVDAVDPDDKNNKYFKIDGTTVLNADDTPVTDEAEKANLLATVKELESAPVEESKDEMGGGRRHSRRNGRRHSRRQSKKRHNKRSKKQNGGKKRNSKRNQKK